MFSCWCFLWCVLICFKNWSEIGAKLPNLTTFEFLRVLVILVWKIGYKRTNGIFKWSTTLIIILMALLTKFCGVEFRA